MSTRLLHVIVPEGRTKEVEAEVAGPAFEHWLIQLEDGRTHVTAVMPGSDVDAVIDGLERALGGVDGFAAVVMPVEAVLAAGLEPKAPPPARPASWLEHFFSRNRLSTEELYDDIDAGTRPTVTFFTFVVASAVIAALGMRSGQTAVVIGAMVIAPFLSPAMAMALAATVGDAALGLRSLLTIVSGASVAVGATVLLGSMIVIDPTVPELAARTVVSQADIGLALASGSAGVLAFCTGLSASLVGVMIAVALVPPLAAAGMLVGSGEPGLAADAFLLFATNLVCINVSGIATFLLQGLPPKSWRLTSGIFALWTVLLGTLSFLIFIRFAV